MWVTMMGFNRPRSPAILTFLLQWQLDGYQHIDTGERKPMGERMSLHKEISFETEICEHLGANGWLYAHGDATGYDRARAWARTSASDYQ